MALRQPSIYKSSLRFANIKHPCYLWLARIVRHTMSQSQPHGRLCRIVVNNNIFPSRSRFFVCYTTQAQQKNLESKSRLMEAMERKVHS